MGKTEKRELISRLEILLLHLLKWRYQPGRRGSSWEATIQVQRDDLIDHLNDNPSLKAKLDEVLVAAYRKAAILVTGETDLPKSVFPAVCPWTFEQIMDADFWPDGEGH